MKKNLTFRDPRSRNEERASHSGGRPRTSSVQKAHIIYGVLPVVEALRANARKIDKIMIAEGIHEDRMEEIVELARRANIQVDRLPKDRFGKYVGPSGNHQGVIAYAAAAEYADADEILESAGSDTLIVVLDGVEDPQNLGAILRASECAGADGVIVPERRAVGLTEAVAKASAGAIEYIKVAKVTNLNRLIADLKEKNIWVVGASGDAKIDYTNWDWTRPSALVLGGEGSGLHRLVAENCDVLVKIPMYGKIESLNVSNAASVILFEIRRQRSVGATGKASGYKPPAES